MRVNKTHCRERETILLKHSLHVQSYLSYQKNAKYRVCEFHLDLLRFINIHFKHFTIVTNEFVRRKKSKNV